MYKTQRLLQFQVVFFSVCRCRNESKQRIFCACAAPVHRVHWTSLSRSRPHWHLRRTSLFATLREKYTIHICFDARRTPGLTQHDKTQWRFTLSLTPGHPTCCNVLCFRVCYCPALTCAVSIMIVFARKSAFLCAPNIICAFPCAPNVSSCLLLVSDVFTCYCKVQTLPSEKAYTPCTD